MSPDEIKKRDFKSQLRGYDKDEVRSFLRRISDEVNRLQEVEAEASRRTPAVLAAEAAQRKTGASSTPPEPPASSLARASALAAVPQTPEMPAAPERPSTASNDGASPEAPVSSPVSANTDTFADEALNPADDRFEALGERIAGLLRDAHMSAGAVREKADSDARDILEQARVEASALQASAMEEAETLRVDAANDSAATRSAAEEEAESIRAEARAKSESMQVELDQQQLELQEFKAASETEAADLRTQSLNAGEVELAGQREETEQQLADARADRDQAMAELADAREQVAELLYQARTQSEFIRHEAEEIIRSKVRQNVEQAEGRLAMLRNSEVASRERLAAAQRELTSAMSRLESEPQPSLPSDADEVVLAEAVERGEATGYGALDALIGDTSADSNEPEADAFADDAQAVDGQFIEADVVEADAFETQTFETDGYEADELDEDVVVAEDVDSTDVDSTDVDMADVDEYQSEVDAFEVDAELVDADDIDSVEIQADAGAEYGEGEPNPEMLEVLLGDTPVTDDGNIEEFTDDVEPEFVESEFTEPALVAEVDAADEDATEALVDDEHLEVLDGEAIDDSSDHADEVDELVAFEAESDLDHIGSEALPEVDDELVEHDEANGQTAAVSDLPTRMVPPIPPAPLVPPAPPIGYSEATETSAPDDLADTDMVTGSESSYDDSFSSDSFGDRDDERVPVAAGVDELEGSPDEDALARLVREAMQRAVDSARSGD